MALEESLARDRLIQQVKLIEAVETVISDAEIISEAIEKAEATAATAWYKHEKPLTAEKIDLIGRMNIGKPWFMKHREKGSDRIRQTQKPNITADEVLMITLRLKAQEKPLVFSVRTVMVDSRDPKNERMVIGLNQGVHPITNAPTEPGTFLSLPRSLIRGYGLYAEPKSKLQRDPRLIDGVYD